MTRRKEKSRKGKRHFTDGTGRGTRELRFNLHVNGEVIHKLGIGQVRDSGCYIKGEDRENPRGG